MKGNKAAESQCRQTPAVPMVRKPYKMLWVPLFGGFNFYAAANIFVANGSAEQ